MSFETLLIEQSNGVATVTLNRPPVNALNRAVGVELGAAFSAFEDDTNVRAIVLTGSGQRAFAAGADIKEIGALSGPEATTMANDWHRVLNAIAVSRIPFIAAVNGVALGGGCELAMACDIRIAASNAVFGQPEINLGIIPGFGGSQRLPRLVGRGRALELLLTGEPIDAQEAFRIGLVNRIVPGEDLLEVSREFASKVAGKGAVALRLIKECVSAGLDRPLGDGLAYEAERFGDVCSTLDKAEGIAAFLEKRKPQFTGR
ncbi:MAG: hypothetical protein HOH43_04840 [Candidatus Latescibacteria bacterium]|nr:hypothetical protein [Candidatus Latescibacterota bacterium]